jgi:hypothetical protein
MQLVSKQSQASSLEILYHRLLDWDIGRYILSSKAGIHSDSAFGNPVSIPDRFLVPSDYVEAFIEPAFLEIKASVLGSLTSDSLPSYEVYSTGNQADKFSPVDTDFIDVALRFRQSNPDSVASKKEPSSLPSDMICVLSMKGSLLAEGPCALGIVRPTRLPGGGIVRFNRNRLENVNLTSSSLCLHPVTSLISGSREFEALCGIRSVSLRDEILLGIATAEEGPATTPVHPLPVPLSAFFETRLNPAQRGVIQDVCGLSGSRYRSKVVLVRGPPGSGKTLTLHSIINALHVQQFNAYYDSIVAAVKAGRMNKSERSWLDLASVSKPRIIVCAPSNVAIDNIILRILSEQFVGGDGNKYTPWLVRIGKGSTQQQEVAKKALSRMVDEIISTTGQDLVAKISKLESLYTELRQGVLLELVRLQCLIAGTPYAFKSGIETRVMVNQAGQFVAYWVDHGSAASLSEMPLPAMEGDAFGPPVEQMPEWILYSKELMRQLEVWEAVHWELQRFRLVRAYIQESMGAPNSSVAMAEKYQLQANLETLLMNQASIVCGTLNSTGLAQVKNSLEFQVCVVDEAAQAVELSTLIPLYLGVKQLVLVGDPQQLPATVLAKRELMGNYERSLFERLENCGVPVHTLDIQYRMHPAISFFSRNQFYKGILKDSESVGRLSPLFARQPYNLNPLMFIDVLAGKDTVSQQTLSRSNPEEAAVCVSMFFALLRMAMEQGSDLTGSVGVISPYAEQVRLLKQSFEAAGIRVSGHLDDIEIATVDSFQGKEKDIIILSTVRSCPDSTSVGFLADMRRMNVALTRARVGLFVVGKSKTLETNDQWASLIQHTKRTPRAYVQVKGPGEDIYGVLANSVFQDASSYRTD